MSVLVRLCQTIAVAARHTPDPCRRIVLAGHLGLIEEAARRAAPEELDRQMVQSSAREARSWLDDAHRHTR